MKVEEGSVGGDSVTDERKEGDPCLEPVARASFTHVYLLALAMKLGGCTIAWNYGFAAGFWEYFLAVIGLGTAYVLFGLCMAEMVSIMTFSGGYYGYARVILGPLGGYLVGWFDLLTLTASEVSDAKRSIPQALIAGIVTVLILAIWLMFTVASQPPGVTPQLYSDATYFPLVFGYMHIFNISYKTATAISAIPIIGSSFAYLYIIAKQVKSMANSALLPKFFSKSITIGNQSIPIVAYIVVCIAGFAANYFAWFINLYRTSSRFASRYSHMERSFKNPFGAYSAIIGSVIFLAVLVILIGFHTEYRGVTILYFSYMAVMLLYYYVHVETNQKFSSMEQKVFFKAYILNFNKRKKKSFFQKAKGDLRRNLSWLFSRFCPSSLLALYPNQDEDSPSTSIKSNSRFVERSLSRSRKMNSTVRQIAVAPAPNSISTKLDTTSSGRNNNLETTADSVTIFQPLE
eukprot:gene7058-7620_t